MNKGPLGGAGPPKNWPAPVRPGWGSLSVSGHVASPTFASEISTKLSTVGTKPPGRPATPRLSLHTCFHPRPLPARVEDSPLASDIVQEGQALPLGSAALRRLKASDQSRPSGYRASQDPVAVTRMVKAHRASSRRGALPAHLGPGGWGGVGKHTWVAHQSKPITSHSTQQANRPWERSLRHWRIYQMATTKKEARIHSVHEGQYRCDRV